MNNGKNCENKTANNTKGTNVKVVNEANNKASSKAQNKTQSTNGNPQNKAKAAAQDNRFQSSMGVGFEQDR